MTERFSPQIAQMNADQAMSSSRWKVVVQFGFFHNASSFEYVISKGVNECAHSFNGRRDHESFMTKQS